MKATGDESQYSVTKDACAPARDRSPPKRKASPVVPNVIKKRCGSFMAA
jgi:hypothetical protein